MLIISHICKYHFIDEHQKYNWTKCENKTEGMYVKGNKMKGYLNKLKKYWTFEINHLGLTPITSLCLYEILSCSYISSFLSSFFLYFIYQFVLHPRQSLSPHLKYFQTYIVISYLCIDSVGCIYICFLFSNPVLDSVRAIYSQPCFMRK